MRGTPRERFFSKVEKLLGKNACWHWKGSVSSWGYGQFFDGERNIVAHWFLLPKRPDSRKGIQACHHCDNRICVRPSHIFLGTRSDNIRDCVAKGRLRAENGRAAALKACRGEGSPKHKLTEDNVREIRRSYSLKLSTMVELGKKYGISYSVINGVIHGRTWRHVK